MSFVPCRAIAYSEWGGGMRGQEGRKSMYTMTYGQELKVSTVYKFYI